MKVLYDLNQCIQSGLKGLSMIFILPEIPGHSLIQRPMGLKPQPCASLKILGLSLVVVQSVFSVQFAIVFFGAKARQIHEIQGHYFEIPHAQWASQSLRQT
jgi:hypothetical protein